MKTMQSSSNVYDCSTNLNYPISPENITLTKLIYYSYKFTFFSSSELNNFHYNFTNYPFNNFKASNGFFYKVC